MEGKERKERSLSKILSCPHKYNQGHKFVRETHWILGETTYNEEGNINGTEVPKGSEIKVYTIFRLSERYAFDCFCFCLAGTPKGILSKPHYHRWNLAYCLQTSWSSPCKSGEMPIPPVLSWKTQSLNLILQSKIANFLAQSTIITWVNILWLVMRSNLSHRKFTTVRGMWNEELFLIYHYWNTIKITYLDGHK